MRILLVNDAYPPVIGGATRAAQQLGRHLVARGHEVVVATSWQRGLAAAEDDDGIEVHRLRGVVSRLPFLSADPVRYTPPPFPDPELVWRLRRLVRAVRPDLVQSYGWLTYSCTVALARLDVPLVLSIREYANICAVRTLVRHGEPCSGPQVAKCTECAGSFYGIAKGTVAVSGVLGLRGALRRRVDGLHSTSVFAQEAARRHLMGARRLPEAVIPDYHEPPGSPDPTILRQLPTEPYILFVGAYRRIKGVETLLDAYGRLASPPPLVLLGARSAEPPPATRPGVTMLFDVPHDTVMAAWDRALFGVAPSLAPEALGNVVHEGMSRGRAVIGTRPGGHEDIIDDGVDGLLVPAGDVSALAEALHLLIEDEGLRARLQAAAVEKARRFTPEAVVPAFEAFWRVVVDTTGA